MIEREKGRFVPACDYCNARLAPEAFKEDAITAMRIAGWNSPKIGERIANYRKECSRHLGIERERGRANRRYR